MGRDKEKRAMSIMNSNQRKLEQLDMTYGKAIYLGSSNDPRELAELYDKKAIELLGEDAITNKN